jgi:DNA gyrase/topoisomerase IV subunit A
LLVYNARGRILRVEPGLETGAWTQLGGELFAAGEAARLLSIPVNEEMLLLFSSGRVSTCPVEEISLQKAGGDWSLDQAALPDEPHGGERLVCITPIARLAMADFFLQSSRRGCIKKTMTSISETIFENHYLGKNTIQRMDQPYDMTLCLKKEFFVLVTHEGRLLGLEVDDLSYALEERIRLGATDHVVAGFIIHPDELLLCMTQNGKVISRSAGFIEPSKSATAHGQALISPARLEQGVRFIGAVPARATSRVALLDQAGNLSLHWLGNLTGAGLAPTEAALVAFTVIPSLEEYPSKTSPAKKPGGGDASSIIAE